MDACRKNHCIIARKSQCTQFPQNKQANYAEKDWGEEEFTSSQQTSRRVELGRSPAWTATEKIIAVSLVNHNLDNTHDASKQSLQTNTGEGESSPLRKRGEMLHGGRFPISQLPNLLESWGGLLIITINNVYVTMIKKVWKTPSKVTKIYKITIDTIKYPKHENY